MKTTLAVEGMSCASCVRHVNQALSLRGITEVDVRLAEGAVVIEHDASVSRDRMIAVLGQAGYDAR